MSEDSSKIKSAEDKNAELLESIENFKKTHTRQVNDLGPNVLIHITQEVINTAVRAGLTDLMIRDIFPASFDGNKKNQMVKAVPSDLIIKRREWRADTFPATVSTKPVEKDVPRINNNHKPSNLQKILDRVSLGLGSFKSKDNQFKPRRSSNTKKVFTCGAPILLICFASYFYLWPSIIVWIDKDHLVQGVENNKSITKNGKPYGKKPEPPKVSSSGKILSATSSATASVTNTVTMAKQDIGGASPSKFVINSTKEFADNIAEAKKLERAKKITDTFSILVPDIKKEALAPKKVEVEKSDASKQAKANPLPDKTKAKPLAQKIVKKKIPPKKKKFTPHITKRVY